MIDNNYLSKMTLSDVSDTLQQNKDYLKKIQENPEIAVFAGVPYNGAIADVFNEQAQLMRRMADIYDEVADKNRKG